MNIPNTFIIGAPKCGTTSMAHYLSQHSQVYMSHIKEPHYFIREDMPNLNTFSESTYLELFSYANDKHKVIMEASVWYLYGKNAAKLIKKFNPNSKLIVMLRRPDEMVYSMHSQNYVSRNDDIVDFETAWKLCSERKQGRNVFKQCKDNKLLAYDEIANYASQLENIYNYFPREQVKVIFYDDFKDNVEREFLSVQKFLELNEQRLTDYGIVNRNTTLKNELFANIITKPPSFILRFSKIVKKIFRIKKIGLRNKLKDLNQRAVQRVPLSKELRIKLIKNYEVEVAKLSSLTGRDLSSWGSFE